MVGALYGWRSTHNGHADRLPKKRILETHPDLAVNWIVSQDVLVMERTDCGLERRNRQSDRLQNRGRSLTLFDLAGLLR